MKTTIDKNSFFSGLKDGLPIGLGYFAVSISLGIMAKTGGITAIQGFLASLFTNASAGEYAAFVVIKENSGYLSMILMTVIASARYFLMSCALSQKFSPSTPFYHRFLIGFNLTDEIFGAQISRPGYIKPTYSYALFILPLIGWSSGTALGILIGTLLPDNLTRALSVSLYGMFIAIIVPPAKKDKIVGFCIIFSFIIGYIFTKIPAFSNISSGTRILILTVIISSIAALLFPKKEEEKEADE